MSYDTRVIDDFCRGVSRNSVWRHFVFYLPILPCTVPSMWLVLPVKIIEREEMTMLTYSCIYDLSSFATMRNWQKKYLGGY